MNRIALVLILVVVAAGAAACTRVHAKAPATRPALEVPPPPPRLIEPLPSEPVAAMEPVADLPPAAPTASRPRPQPQREAASRESSKPEPKVETPPPAEPVATSPAPPPNAVPQIRTPADNSETARLVRDLIDRANKTLNTIDYRLLNRQRKESYDTAKRFITQAEDAVKISNFAFALKVAEKADTLAKELQSR